MENKYYDLKLIERDCKGMKWGLWEDEGGEIGIVFDKDGDLAGFEDEKVAERFVNDYALQSSWEIGTWEDYGNRGEY